MSYRCSLRMSSVSPKPVVVTMPARPILPSMRAFVMSVVAFATGWQYGTWLFPQAAVFFPSAWAEIVPRGAVWFLFAGIAAIAAGVGALRAPAGHRGYAVFRSLTKLRERLVPYLAASAADTVRTDRPLMRPLFFDHPDAPEVWTATQWMLGDDLLVAPVLEPGVDSWPVALPAGEWTDVWTGETVTGGRTVRVDAPINRVPVFARAGAPADLLAVFRP